jgi:hypothetical protein
MNSKIWRFCNDEMHTKHSSPEALSADLGYHLRWGGATLVQMCQLDRHYSCGVLCTIN